METCLIVSVAKNKVIGEDGQIPWNYPIAKKRFDENTYGHKLIMGRKTYESIKSKIENRKIVVLSKNKDFSVPEGVTVCDSLTKAIAIPHKSGKQFIYGGENVYKDSIPLVHKIYLTYIYFDYAGDRFFDYDFLFRNTHIWQRVNTQTYGKVHFYDFERIK